MNLHEYQAKELFRDYGIAVSEGIAVSSGEEAEKVASSLNVEKWVVKAQVHAGGRGKAGGVEVVSDLKDVRKFADKWIGQNLITFQTDTHGQPVNEILIETCTDIDTELYLGAVIDRASQRLVVMASTEGGVNIEEVAEETPDKIFKVEIDPIQGPQKSQADFLSNSLGLDSTQCSEFNAIFDGLVKLFLEKDLSLVEVNPLVITTSGNLICLDAKINVDSNALYRQEEVEKLRDQSQEDPREARAAEWDLSYVALEGNIGCMVNGAGLAMGTMDIIKLHGGEPANFLDVGGTADSKRVAEAFKIILSDENVKTVLINIFGGIVRCDVIADGIVEALTVMGVSVPVVVRLEGNSASEGIQILDDCELNIIPASNLEEAARLAVNASKGEI
ncbi:MAG: ADP-forming succinate--CoA ligase subunit beta [SAR86 cluster bacterium]|nr:ADP-forming succinate--CoA ligase subunit beta [SAR86 cluster bacterium]